MNTLQYARVQALRDALDQEVHGLWISDEMAVKILARLDAVTSALKLTSEKNDSNTDASGSASSST
ncbi:hypothetical protein R70211_05379 [Paraburkholderia domus]|uniref:Uncharacterized protein n=1 Tax=Paraburkholderia domus TaxID=2793075 RepID=A0A9N8R2E6_9BURK|nr:hypothetical protein R70211_05379 [Paraburkholderia domus]